MHLAFYLLFLVRLRSSVYQKSIQTRVLREEYVLVTKLCQVSPSLNVANVHLVLLGTQAVVEGAQLPGGQLAHFWGQIHEGHIPTGTSVSAATQNTLFQMDDL